MALGHDGLLHEVLGLQANLFLGCPPAQKAFANSGNPSLLQRILNLIFKPSLDLSTFQVVTDAPKIEKCHTTAFNECHHAGCCFRHVVWMAYIWCEIGPLQSRSVVQGCSKLPMLACSTVSTTVAWLT